MAVYAALGLSRALLGSILALVVVIFALFSSKRLHNEAARSVIRAPMSFFDTTPMGRIITATYQPPAAFRYSRYSFKPTAPVARSSAVINVFGSSFFISDCLPCLDFVSRRTIGLGAR